MDEEVSMFDNNHYDLPDRHSARLQSYDYRQPGYYYVTICVTHRQCLLSSIVNAQIHLSSAGSVIQSEWNKLPERFQHVRLDQYVIMPNHFHGIVIFEGPQALSENMDESHIPTRFRQYINGTEQIQRMSLDSSHHTTKNSELPILGEVIRTFKEASTYHIRKTVHPDFAWEGRLYDHVIRNIADLARVRNYIFNNPASWQEDVLYQRPL